MMRTLGTLAYGTFRETVRDRLFYLVGIFGFTMLASTAVLSPLTIGAQGKIMTDVGLGAMAAFGLLVVVLVGSNMIRKEMDKGTIVTILARPVGRQQYLIGKFLGLNLTLACMLALMGALFYLVLLVAPGTFSPAYLGAIYMTLLELVVVNAVVVLFSTCVSAPLAAVATLGVFLMGHLSQSIRDFGALQGSPLQQKLFAGLYYLVPNLEVFNIRGAVVHGDPVVGAQFGMATIYALGYAGLLVILAGAVFRRKGLR